MRSSSPRPRGFLGPSSTVTARETLAKRGWWAGARPTGRAPVPRHHPGHGPRRRGRRAAVPARPARAAPWPRADLGLDFEHTRYAFLESPGSWSPSWLLLIITVVIERRRPGSAETGADGAALGGIAIGLGALLFAGSVGRPRRDVVGGLVPGLACAFLGQAAARPLFGRVRQAPGRRGAPGAAALRRRRVAGRGRPVDHHPAGVDPHHRLLGLAAGSAAAGARARSTQACAR